MRNISKWKMWRIPAVLLVLGTVLAVCAILADSTAKWPEATGQTVWRDSKLKIDGSNLSEGYFMACTSSKTKKRLKMRVVKGDVTLTYDLNSDGDMEVFPLQLGSGNYSVKLYENVQGKSYSQVGTINLRVSLTREDGAFLYPNQYVNYSAGSPVVEEAETLCAGKTEKQAFDAVCAYMKGYMYDYVKAATVKSGMMPDIDGTYKKRMGICQDLSAVMICMLRTQGIPAKMMIGWADKNYHAWVIAMIDGEEVFYDPTAALKAIANVKSYTVERFY